MINDANTRARKGRLKRLKFLLSTEMSAGIDIYRTSSLAKEYLEETRLCWFVGAFVATIMMAEVTMEELLRSFYRAIKGVNGRLTNGKKLNEASFFDFIEQSVIDGLLNDEESRILNNLRKTRNPWIHTLDNIKDEPFKPNWSTQELKIVAPELLNQGVEDEAREVLECW